MSDDLQKLEAWAATLLTRWQPKERRRLLRELATTLRISQQQRISAQLNPDSSPFTPRKPRKLLRAKHLRNKAQRIRRRAMFTKLKTARFLKSESDENSLAIGFIGKAARLAHVHQYGQVDRVAPGGPRYRYPVRKLLGLTEEDRTMILEKCLASFLS